jgi:hypothetical protein
MRSRPEMQWFLAQPRTELLSRSRQRGEDANVPPDVNELPAPTECGGLRFAVPSRSPLPTVGIPPTSLDCKRTYVLYCC